MPEKHVRRKNTLLFIVLLASMAVSCLVTIRRLESESAPVSLPVTFVAGQASDIDGLRHEVKAEEDADLAALREISRNELLDAATRESAAAQLSAMIARRESHSALEAALSSTSLAPCTVILTEGSVTVVTAKETISQAESAMVVTLADTHAGVEPSGVRIITNSGK